MLASPEPVEAFTFTFNLSQVGTLKIRGTFRAKNRQQPHPLLVLLRCMVEREMSVVRSYVCIVLRGALVQLCCTIAFVKFDTHRAGPRWTGGGTPTLRNFFGLGNFSEYDIRRVVRPNPEYFRRRMSPTVQPSAEFMSGGGRGLAGRETVGDKTPGPPQT